MGSLLQCANVHFTFNLFLLPRAIIDLLHLPQRHPLTILSGQSQESSHRFELNLCFTLLFPPAGRPVPRLPSFSNEYLCLLPPLAPYILSSHLTVWDRLEDSSGLLGESIMLSSIPLLTSPLQVTLSIISSLKLAILHFRDGPQS